MYKKNDILIRTLQRLESLYREESVRPGVIAKIVIKPQWNVIIGTDGQCGMAINFTGVHDIYDNVQLSAAPFKALIGRELAQVARENIGSSDMQQRGIGIAAMSALSQPFLAPRSLEKRGFEIIGDMTHLADFVTADDTVAIVGYGGIVRTILGKCRDLHVTEMRPAETFRTIIVDERVAYGPQLVTVHPAEENEAVLGEADVVIVTGSSLVNGTFGELMSYAAGARAIGLYGPSVSFLPDVLFDDGVHFILTYHVKDAERFEFDALNDVDMEVALKRFQGQQVIRRRA
jgi:uncharacterized protein (DUF4213/DUF364 family)